MVGVRSRTPVPTDTGSPTLPCARPPHLAMGRRVTEPVRGGCLMRPISARPEQSPLSVELLLIVRNALRAAVLAPTDTAALDVSAAALLAVAERVEQSPLNA